MKCDIQNAVSQFKIIGSNLLTGLRTIYTKTAHELNVKEIIEKNFDILFTVFEQT